MHVYAWRLQYLWATVPSTAKWMAIRRRGPLKASSPSGEYTSLQKGSFRTAFVQGVSNSSL